MRNVHIYVDGMVQAVGYRTFIKRQADFHKIRGYVRNIEGGIEIVAEGDDKAMEEFLDDANEGPAAAEITNLTIEEKVPNYLFKDFTIRP